MIRLICCLSFILISAGCTPDIVDGGPCEYIPLEDKTEVVNVTDTVVVLNGINPYEVKHNMFEERPVIGDRYLVKALTITQGSCNPISVRSVEKL